MYVQAEINRAVASLKKGGVIAYPTEAVWGLGCDPNNIQAIEKVLGLKKRSVDKGLILIGSSADQFSGYIQGLDGPQKELFKTLQSRPTTWLVPDNGTASQWVVGEHDTVALRITDHPVAKALCDVFGGPIVSTSANPQGKPAAIEAADVEAYFEDSLDHYVMGCVAGIQSVSEIKNLLTGEVLRSG